MLTVNIQCDSRVCSLFEDLHHSNQNMAVRNIEIVWVPAVFCNISQTIAHIAMSSDVQFHHYIDEVRCG